MLVRHIEFNEKKRTLVPNWNTGVTTHSALVDRFFKELIPGSLAANSNSLNYSMIDAFVKDYPIKSHLGLETGSVVLTNYDSLESKIELLETPVVVTIAGDIGSGKTTILRAIKHFRKKDLFVAYLDLELYPCVTSEELMDKIKVNLVACIEREIPVFIQQSGMQLANPLSYHVFQKALETLGFMKNGIVQNQSAIDAYLLDLTKNRKERDFGEYCQSYFAFLQNNGMRVVVILDDVDKFKDIELARGLVDGAQGQIAGSLGVPIIITVRHETVMKFRDACRPVPVRYIIRSVDPRTVLERRSTEFSNWATDPKMTNGKPMPDEQIEFVNKRAAELCGGRFIDQLAKMNPSCDFILDVFRTVVMSPLIRRDKDLTWGLIFNTLMLHVWNYMDPISSFIVNVYDNDGKDIREGQEYKNTLLRIRLMQAIKMIGKGVYSRSISIEDIFAVLLKCGYDDQGDIRHALSHFAQRRIIITPHTSNKFDHEVSHIYLHKALEFYLDDLAMNYLYLENIIPVTLVDIRVDMTPYSEVPTLEFGYKEFKIMDRNIYNFIRFLEKCEEQEESVCNAKHNEKYGINGINDLIEVRGEKQWSNLIKESLINQIGDSGRELSTLIEDKRTPYPRIVDFG